MLGLLHFIPSGQALCTELVSHFSGLRGKHIEVQLPQVFVLGFFVRTPGDQEQTASLFTVCFVCVGFGDPHRVLPAVQDGLLSGLEGRGTGLQGTLAIVVTVQALNFFPLSQAECYKSLMRPVPG